MSDNYGVQIERLAAQFEESKRVNEELRASNATLKAESAALKDRVRVQNLEGINPFKITMREYDALQAKLSRYTSWQPSDPGTKEVMAEIERRLKGVLVSDGLTAVSQYGSKSIVGDVRYMIDALRSAMVRLEEAEKKIKLDEKAAEQWRGI